MKNKNMDVFQVRIDLYEELHEAIRNSVGGAVRADTRTGIRYPVSIIVHSPFIKNQLP
jgi:hypothetical protein